MYSKDIRVQVTEQHRYVASTVLVPSGNNPSWLLSYQQNSLAQYIVSFCFRKAADKTWRCHLAARRKGQILMNSHYYINTWFCLVTLDHSPNLRVISFRVLASIGLPTRDNLIFLANFFEAGLLDYGHDISSDHRLRQLITWQAIIDRMRRQFVVKSY